MSVVHRMVNGAVEPLKIWLIGGMKPDRLVGPAVARALRDLFGEPEVMETRDPSHILADLREAYVWAGKDPIRRGAAFDTWATGLRVTEKELQDKPAGWGWPNKSRRAHWFREAEMKSVCGKWVFFGEREEDAMPAVAPSEDKCFRCVDILMKPLMEKTVGRPRKVRKDKGIPRGPKKKPSV